MVVEKGLNYLYDGTWIEAGTLEGSGQWQSVEYSSEFPARPIVVS
jgi:hypothetical protein